MQIVTWLSWRTARWPRRPSGPPPRERPRGPTAGESTPGRILPVRFLCRRGFDPRRWRGRPPPARPRPGRRTGPRTPRRRRRRRGAPVEARYKLLNQCTLTPDILSNLLRRKHLSNRIKLQMWAHSAQATGVSTSNWPNNWVQIDVRLLQDHWAKFAFLWKSTSNKYRIAKKFNIFFLH